MTKEVSFLAAFICLTILSVTVSFLYSLGLEKSVIYSLLCNASAETDGFTKEGTRTELFPVRTQKEVRRILHNINIELSRYHEELNTIRNSHINNTVEKKSWIPLPDAKILACSFDENYFDQIGETMVINTIKVNLAVEDVVKILSPQVYHYSGNDCQRLEMASGGKAVDIYRDVCVSNLSSLLNQMNLPYQMFKVGLPRHSNLPKKNMTVNYMHVLTNALVTVEGDIFVGQYKIVPQRCKHKNSHLDKQVYPDDLFDLHDEVLTIAQFWGEGFFHAVAEEIPRLSVWLPFLREHVNVKIHVYSKQRFLFDILRHLGLHPSRIITGHSRARVLYFPAGTRCGAVSFFNGQMLSLHLQASLPDKDRSSIVLIKRHQKRYLTHHKEILRTVNKTAMVFGFHVKVFRDDPLPSFRETMDMFHGAAVIMGPHGAGLTNIFFSQPGTLILEGLCLQRGRPNLCYRNIAKMTGHRYYGILAKGPYANIEPDQFNDALTFFLQHNAKL